MPKVQRQYFGFTRAIDGQGRILIPPELKKELNLNAKDEVELKLVIINKKQKVIEISKKGE